MATAPTPSYDLDWIKHLVASGRYAITRRAGRDAQDLGFDEKDIVGCVLATKSEQLHKTMPSDKNPGTQQDVYYTCWCGTPIYLKLQVATADAVIISFHRNTSA